MAVFVDGCFWHGCADHATLPASNRAFWAEKIARNRQRDADTNRLMSDVGWLVLRFWEHESPVSAADRVEQEWRRRT
jgi:DNA mismatch endonuclease (patch repair protein)